MERKREGWMGRKANKRMDSRCRRGKAKVVENKGKTRRLYMDRAERKVKGR